MCVCVNVHACVRACVRACMYETKQPSHCYDSFRSAIILFVSDSDTRSLFDRGCHKLPAGGKFLRLSIAVVLYKR